VGLARRREQLVRRCERRALRIEQRPEHLDQLLPERPQDGGDGHVPAIGSADVPAAGERERIADRRLVALVQAAAGRDRRAGKLRLHGGDRADLRESFL
jgi:hypothetical protein